MILRMVQKIAREKAGILKPGIPGFTVQQPEDALEALQVRPQELCGERCIGCTQSASLL